MGQKKLWFDVIAIKVTQITKGEFKGYKVEVADRITWCETYLVSKTGFEDERTGEIYYNFFHTDYGRRKVWFSLEKVVKE